MGILGFILLIIALAYLIYDDRKQFAELRKFKKLMRKANREAWKESWQRIRNRVANPRNAAHEKGVLLKETKLYHGVILEFSFPEYRQGNLDFINETLSRYALKDVTVTDHTGALVRSENGDGQYALKSCTLKCDLMPSGSGLDFRISTMAAAKTVRDCGLLWQQKNPDRKLCRKVFRELGIAYALVVVHHNRAVRLPEREIIPRDRKPQVRTVPVPPKKAPPVRSDGKTKYCCGRPGKDTLVFRYEDGTLYIEGQGRLRCGQWPWLTAPIRHVVIAPGCTAIADFAFRNHENLEAISLPDTLRTIGERAFAGSRLRAVVIPDSVTGIGKGAFDGCMYLEQVQLPRNLTQIHDDTFRGCISLRDVQIPDRVHYIGKSAFWRVYSINDLPSFLGSNRLRRHYGIRYRQKSGIRENAFGNVKKIKSCVIPSGVREIPYGAFWNTSIDDLELPASLQEIGEYAFSCCNDLKSVAVPDSVTAIGRDAFRGVHHITYHGPAQTDDNWGALSRN